MSKICLDINSGSNMYQNAYLRPVVRKLDVSCRRKLISEVLDVIAASSTPDCIAL